MPTERLVAIFDLMEHREKSDDERGALCLVAAEVLHLDGAAFGLTSKSLRLTSFCSTSGPAQSLMDLEITLGERPATDASTADEVVEMGNLQTLTNPR